MKVMVLTVAGLLSWPVNAAPVGCSDLLMIGQAAAERVNLLQTAQDEQRRLASTVDGAVALPELGRAARQLEQAVAKLKIVVASARNRGCEGIDALVEAESQAEENVQAVQADAAGMFQPDATGSIGSR